MRHKPLINLSLLLLTFGNGFALKSDQQMPYNIVADQATFARDQHISTFIGHVEATQGSRKMTGSKLIVYLNQHNKQIRYLLAFGRPATYSMVLDDKKQHLNAQADIIRYYPLEQRVILKNSARVTQANNKITGPYITYDLNKDIVTTKGNKKQPRTTITLQPTPK